MKKLFIETKEGKLPINNKLVEKYNLEKGTRAPFSQGRIVDCKGDYNYEKSPHEEKKPENKDLEKFLTSEIDEMDNGLAMSTSEILDFSQGVDSSNR